MRHAFVNKSVPISLKILGRMSNETIKNSSARM